MAEELKLELPQPQPTATPVAHLAPVAIVQAMKARVQPLVQSLCQPKGLALRLIKAFVLIPGLLVFIYLLFFASDMYISEAKFAVRGQNSSSPADALSTLFRVPSNTQSDSYIVLNYIQSPDMFGKLDASLKLKEHYSSRKNDIWYRLWGNATQDEIRDYWQWACKVSYDPDTSILGVEIKAFSPEMALAIANGILKYSEDLVNGMNLRSRQDAIAQAGEEVARAEQRIRKAHEAMRQYRENTVILDPEAVAKGLYGVVNGLEAEVTQTAAELAEVLTYMKGNSPRVAQLRNRLKVLRSQLKTEKDRLASARQSEKPLSALVSEFQSLTLEEEFAQKQLTSAMASLETARIQADAQSLYIEAFQRPVLADESLYPRPFFFTFIFMMTALLLLGLVSLIIAAVREHAGF